MGFEALLSERFRIVSRLGEGAYGTVYEAIDTQRDERVAVKVLHRIGGDAIFRFKQEFRSLRDVRHTNLVELGELIESDSRYMFTMELVRGTDFLGHVRPLRSQPPTDLLAGRQDASARLDERRLRAALAQLALGLSALHAAGKVHRDIKPTNVRVDPDGRVVLLDFGLLMDESEQSGSAATSLVGTAAYMSPEQAGSKPVTPASDWYSVGVLLYEALTGRRPFTGPALQVLFDKQQQAPAPPGVHVEGVPADLEALCMALLRADPDARPVGAEVVRILGESVSGQIVAAPQGFFGRDTELRFLQECTDALVGGVPAGHLYISGETGVGKSRLIDEWLARVRRHQPSTLVLRGRAHEAESVSFRAFDGVIDALSHALRQMPAAELEPLLPELGAGALVQVFPVLGRLDVLARHASELALSRDPWTARSEAFDALRHLFRALAASRPVVVVLDDLHLADSDSLQLLERLMATPAPPLMLVAAGASPERCGRAVHRFIQRSLRPEGARLIALTGMEHEEGAQYAEVLLRQGPHGWSEPFDHDLGLRIAQSAHGHPLFIRFLVRHGSQGTAEVPVLREALERRVAALSLGERQVLGLLAVSSAPLSEALLRAASRLPGAEVHRHLSELSRSALVAEQVSGERRAHSISQDQVREAVLGGLDEARRREAHASLAAAYTRVEPDETESLAIHLSASGQTERALHFAVLAAGAAFDALAFDRAARLYRLALDLDSSQAREPERRRRLWSRRGDALAAAGRAREAADAYLEAARGASSLELDRLRTLAAQQMMQAGDVVEALELVRELLGRVGASYPRTPLGVVSGLLYERARLRLRGMEFESRGETWASALDLHEVDLLWSASSMISMVDIVRGLSLQTRHLLRALDVGEPYRLSRAIAMEAQMLQSQRPRPDPVATELFAQARMLAEQSGNPHAHAVVSLGEGIAALGIGRFPQALAKLDDAQTTLRRRCRGATWELDTTQYQLAITLMYMGRFGELNRRVPRLISEARERGDRYLEALLAMAAGYWGPLLSGDLAAARESVEAGLRLWREAGFQSQGTLVCVGSVYCALCAEPERAREAYERTAPHVEAQAVRRVPSLRVLLTTLRAQSELASSLEESGSEARVALRKARKAAQALAAESLGYAPAFSSLVAATVAHREGDSMRAVSLLTEAASGFQAHGMGMYAAASRYREGQLIGGERGREQQAAAIAWVVEQGVGQAEALLRTASPGFPGL